jgi:hypothetical protein
VPLLARASAPVATRRPELVLYTDADRQRPQLRTVPQLRAPKNRRSDPPQLHQSWLICGAVHSQAQPPGPEAVAPSSPIVAAARNRTFNISANPNLAARPQQFSRVPGRSSGDRLPPPSLLLPLPVSLLYTHGARPARARAGRARTRGAEIIPNHSWLHRRTRGASAAASIGSTCGNGRLSPRPSLACLKTAGRVCGDTDHAKYFNGSVMELNAPLPARCGAAWAEWRHGPR